MSRANRLLQLIQILRSHRYPVSGKKLADELNISLRTLYRDIQTLQQRGAQIEGEAGLGYILRPGFMLPPLMFSEVELEALILGSLWVADRGDGELRDAAKQALAKIAAVLPESLRHELETSTVLIGPSDYVIHADEALSCLREVIRNEEKVCIDYTDQNNALSERVIWPFALGFFDAVRVVLGWCELRNDFRCFRVDRIRQIKRLNIRYPAKRRSLLNQWKTINHISLNDRYQFTADNN